MMGAAKRGKLFTRKALVVLAHLGALSSCLKGQGLDTTDYFPLHVGDSSIYYTSIPCPPSSVHERHGPSLYSLVTDTVRIRGEKYFIRDKFFLSPDTLRRDGAGNILIRTNGEDGVFYRLNVAVGDTWNFPIRLSGEVLYYTVTLQSRTDTVTVHAGQFTDCLRFYFDIPSVHDDEFWDWLAPSVGLVFRCIQEPKELYSARVGGVEYPRTVSVPVEDTYPIEHFFLYQNYPNPFNPETVIEYELKSRAHIELKIADALGREIRTLAKRFSFPGRYGVIWDGKDTQGRIVASGIYICRLDVDGFHLSKKLLFIK
jgi:hypothetical protein